MICPNCKFETNDNYCPVCGYQLKSMPNPPQNGYPNSGGTQLYNYGTPVAPSPVQQFPQQKKKKTGKGIAIAIVAVMIVAAIAFVGIIVGISTSDDSKKVLGEWSCQLDFTDYMNKGVAEDSDIAEYYGEDFRLKDMTIDATIIFEQNKHFKLKISDEAKEKLVNSVIDQYVDALYENYGSEENTKEDIREMFEKEFNTETIFGDYQDYDFYYNVRNDKIYLNEESANFDISPDYFEYKFEGRNKLILESCSSEKDDELFGSFPITLEKN